MKASKDEVMDVITDLVRINEFPGTRRKVDGIAALMQTTNEVNQLVALQYVATRLVQPDLNDYIRSGRSTISKQEREEMFAVLIPLIARLAEFGEPDIRNTAIWALEFAPRVQARPIVERAGASTNATVKAAANEMLRRWGEGVGTDGDAPDVRK